jgi:8-oxo-dGTP pyrophosphatase MutT (NUDIX family)
VPQCTSSQSNRVNSEVLRTQLERYLPSDVREAEFKRRMLLLSRAAAPFSRKHFEPGHFTASAFVISPERDAVLLIFHKKLQIWVQPGGHVDDDDVSIAAAARREVGEEVGISTLEPYWAASAPPSSLGEAIFDIDIHSIPARKDEPAHEHFDVRFAFLAPTSEFSLTGEVADVRWVRLDHVEQQTNDESVIRAVRKLSTTR